MKKLKFLIIFYLIMTDEVDTIVIDNGSGIIKAGFAGKEDPCSYFPSFVGRPRCDVSYIGIEDIFIGNEARVNACISTLKYPIERGIVMNWDDMERIWHHTFDNELKVDPSEHPVLITEAMRNPPANREKMIQLIFETFNVPSFSIFISSYLSVIAKGRITGIACDIGEGVSQILPVYDGKTIQDPSVRINFGGSDLLRILQRNIEKCGYYLTTSEEKEIIREIFEKKGYVAIDYDSEIHNAKSPGSKDFYDLPDGNSISLSKECFFNGPELLFKPHMNGFEFDCFDKIIVDSISKCPQNIQKELFENIILSGGVSLLNGLSERICNEINNRVSPSTNIRIIAGPDSKYGAWIGGSIIGSTPSLKSLFVTHDEYNDVGPGISHQFFQ